MNLSLFRRYPLLLPSAAMMLGIWTASHFRWPVRTWFFSFAIFLALVGTGWWVRRRMGLRILSIGMFCFLLGWFRIGDLFFQDLPPALQDRVEQQSVVEVLVDVKGYCRSGPRNHHFTGKLLGYFSPIGFQPLPLEVRWTLGGSACPVRPGGRYRFSARFYLPNRFLNPFSFDYPRYLRGQGILVSGYIRSPEVIQEIRPPAFYHRFAEKTRGRLLSALENSVHSGEIRGVMEALLIGEERALSPEVEEAFRRTGLTHVLVVSGLHITLLLLLFYFPPYLLVSLKSSWSESGLAKKFAMCVALLPVLFYCGMIGWAPSIVRSLVMAAMVLLAALSYSRKNIVSILLLALFLMLLIDPKIFFDFSFQLSFLSLGAIGILGIPFSLSLKKFGEKIPLLRIRWLRGVLDMLWISVTVNLVLFPRLATSFHEISLVAPLANLVLVPYFTFVLLPGEIFAAFFSLLQPTWGEVLFVLLADLTKPFLILLQWLASMDHASILVSPFKLRNVPAYFFFLLGLYFFFQPKKLAVAWLSSALFWGVPESLAAFRESSPELRLIMLDVGQGESLLLQFPNGENWLVDGGGFPHRDFDVGRNVVAPELLGRGIRSLDALVMTHPDADHIKGFFYLVEKFPVRNFYLSPQALSHSDFIPLKSKLEERGIPLRVLSRHFREIRGGVSIEALWPPEKILAGEVSDNDQSLVLKTCFEKICFLLTGDLESEGEEALVKSGESLVGALLKVAHHGSKSSSSEAFLQSTHSRLALISAGRKNRFRLPHPEVLSRLKRQGISVLRTDEVGQIEVWSDGIALRYRSFIDAPTPSWWFAIRRGTFGSGS